MNITVKDILKITKGNLLYGDENEVCENYSRDTREIQDGDIFVGIKGENHDGCNLYKEALLAGAKGCLVNKKREINVEKIDGKFVIEVENTIKAIQEIAKYKRQQYDIPVVAVTGSVGKTSTKDIIANVLSQKYKVLKTQANMNNHIGLPMTILKLKDHTAMVVEMGMNHFGEISTLTNIAKPTIAVITNVGTSHIGILGSRENILKAKLEILEGLSKDGTLIINNDNDLLHKWYTENKHEINILTYGINSQSDLVATNINYRESTSTYEIKENDETKMVEVPVGGEAFVYNSLAALSIAKLLDIYVAKAINGVKTFSLTPMRLDTKKNSKGCMIIIDCYNANYDSMKSSLNYLGCSNSGRKIAVLGDMLELGSFSKELHEKVGEEVVKNKVDILVTVGNEAKNIAKVAKNNNIVVYEFENNQDAINKLEEILEKNDTVLVKASNGMKFKEIAEIISK